MTKTRRAGEPATILVVDDDEAQAALMRRLLAGEAGHEVHVALDGRHALPMFRSVRPDLVIVDLLMPAMDGYDVIRQLVARRPEGEFLPIVVMSGERDVEARQRALELGADEFLAKPADPGELLLRVARLLGTRATTAGLTTALREKVEALEAAAGEVRLAELEVAQRLALVAELRDYASGAHVERVGRIAALTARKLGLDEDRVALLRRAAPLHDIGKLAIPEELLLREGELSLAELDLVKSHAVEGARLLAGSRSAVMQMAEEIALYHHENWDGTGYTPGLAGDMIPIEGRIVAVADVYDALVHDRPYKAAWASDAALEWIREARGRKFDPEVTDAFLAVTLEEDLSLVEPALGLDPAAFTRARPR